MKCLLYKVTNLENVKESFNHELDKVHLMVDNKEKIIEGKGCRIQELESKLMEMQAAVRETYGDFLFKCRDLSREQFLSVLENLDREKHQVLEQFEVCNEQLTREVQSNQKLQNLLSNQRLKMSKLEANLRKLLFLMGY